MIKKKQVQVLIDTIIQASVRQQDLHEFISSVLPVLSFYFPEIKPTTNHYSESLVKQFKNISHGRFCLLKILFEGIIYDSHFGYETMKQKLIEWLNEDKK